MAAELDSSVPPILTFHHMLSNSYLLNTFCILSTFLCMWLIAMVRTGKVLPTLHLILGGSLVVRVRNALNNEIKH